MSGDANPSESLRWDYEVDVLVAGSGNGGMTAGIVAAQQGVRTMVIEMGSVNGGSSAWAGGVLTPNFARSQTP
jgi:3-oxosteroid 1-dehydrogenase